MQLRDFFYAVLLFFLFLRPNANAQIAAGCQGDKGCKPSFIIVDTAHHGFAFSDPSKGHYVSFDILGEGRLSKVSWPKPESGDAWLVYDRDRDGVIKDGTELFGNFTPHSNFTDPTLSMTDRNGFIALGWYDQRPQGGNGDEIIDKRDPIWKKLRLWIDTHCYASPDAQCQSRPNELHTLESERITSLSLMYDYDPMNKDKYGNWFKFYVLVNPDIANRPVGADGRSRGLDPDKPGWHDEYHSSRDGRRAYNVFLKAVE